MSAGERSLRRVIESWLGTRHAKHIRVTRLSQRRRQLCRYVRVEVDRDKGTLVIVFFRHDDGSWCVFPPTPRSPIMGTAIDNHGSVRWATALPCEP